MTFFDDDLRTIFGDKADELSEHHRQMLRRLWDGGREHERKQRQAAFDQGRTAGLRELGVFFSRVLRKRRMDQVFFLRSSNLEYQPWARAALQQVLDAPDLEEASRVASELERMSTDALMRRFGQVPPAELARMARESMPAGDERSVEQAATELEMLQALWEREDDREMRKALQEETTRRRR